MSCVSKERHAGSAELQVFRVLLVSTADLGGGAEMSAWNLLRTYRGLGHESWLAVGTKRTADPSVVWLPQDQYRRDWAKFWVRVNERLRPFEGQFPGVSRLRAISHWIGEPLRSLGIARGHEDFEYPSAWQLLKLTGSSDIIHCFNLHGGYFDLRVLPWLCYRRPVILDLRDAWLLSGHCAHSLDCERWKTGCGQCPALDIYPAINRDGTAFNWRRKQQIFARSRFYVSTPSKWLMDKVHESMLAPAIEDWRIIPTGIDLSIFQPGEQKRARAELGLPQDAKVLLFAANGIRRNVWKDYRTILGAVGVLSERLRGQPLLFVGLGEDSPPERIGDATIHFVKHTKNPEEVARYYQAADVYVHAATADTFPRAVLEALACGRPVVATDVGGIPEQINDMETPSRDGDATGIIIPPRDFESMANGIEKLLRNDSLRRALGQNAAKDAARRFDLVKQANCYLEWYQELVAVNRCRLSSTS
jgi:glycosyltransferase involved in cell wall biosynthesis